jgi:flagellar hook-associated protein 3 FlgL
MQRITDNMLVASTLSGIQSSLHRLDQTQQELSTGLKINQPSDDPYGTSLSMQLQGQISQLTQFTGNVNDATSWTSASSTALSNIDNMVQRIRELVVGAANGTNSASDLQASASEVQQLTAAIKQEANATYNGQYIFSGTATGTAPYLSGANDTFQGNAGAITRQIGPGTSMNVNSNVSSVLGSGGGDGKLLDVLGSINADLTSGSPTALASLGATDLSSLDSNTSNLTQMQADVGALQDRLQLATTRIQGLQTSAATELSNTRDADMATVMTQYSTQQAALQAALKAAADIVQPSLLNFLGSTA